MTQKRRVYDALTGKPQTPKAIAAKVGLTPVRVAALCQQLVKEGKAVHLSRGYRRGPAVPPVPKPPPPVPKPPAGRYAGPPRVPWLLEPGVYLYSAQNTIDGFPEKAAAADFTWVAFLIHEGNRPAQGAALSPDLERRCRAVGLHVAAWGSVFGEPQEGRVAATLAAGYDAYIINAEAAYKLTGPQAGETHPEWFARADTFAADYQAAGGRPGGISTLVGADIHYRPLVDAGLNVVHVQTYTNELPGVTPAVGVARAVDSVQHDFPGWSARLVAPTVGSYGSFRKPLAEYLPLLEAAGCGRRWNFYSGEFLTDADFRAMT